MMQVGVEKAMACIEAQVTISCHEIILVVQLVF